MRGQKTKNHIVKLTSSLIRFKSIKSEPSELKRIIDFIAKYYANDAVVIQRFNKNNKPTIVVLPKGTKKPKVFFLSHADVVEAENEKDFMPAVKGNRLFGRGSADMKSGLAVSMLVFKNYYATKPVGLIVTTDEEIGGFDGAGVVAKQFSSDLVIACESSNLDVVMKEKGVFWVRLIAQGKACHGSMP
jgi:succinyl-diaminopimelate desuccinylase